jgi:octopine/nopaline transport system substrate-binding protein
VAVQATRTGLQRRVVGVQIATVSAMALATHFPEAVQVRSYNTYEDLELDLRAGRIDGLLAGETVVRDIATRVPGLEATGPKWRGLLFGSGIGLGFRKGDELKPVFDNAIKGAIADGTVKRLSEKWFGVDLTPQ